MYLSVSAIKSLVAVKIDVYIYKAPPVIIFRPVAP